jgi:hypothetical protein
MLLLLLLLLQVRLHIGLDHENIISLYAAFQEAGNVVMVQVRTQQLQPGRCYLARVKSRAVDTAAFLEREA